MLRQSLVLRSLLAAFTSGINGCDTAPAFEVTAGYCSPRHELSLVHWRFADRYAGQLWSPPGGKYSMAI